jgi:membrane-associated phospholipid phosphatase
MLVTDSGTVLGGHLEDHWFAVVNHWSRVTPWLHGPAELYAEYGVVLFAGLLLVSWWLARRDGDLRRVTAAVWAPVGVLVALGVNQLLGASVDEPRPYTAMPHTLVLVSKTTDFSFPSDHAVMAGAVAAGVLLVNRRLGLVAVALALLMAVTRVYVGAHFPLDVAAGLIVGAGASLVSYMVVRPMAWRLVELMARTPLRVLCTAVPAPVR